MKKKRVIAISVMSVLVLAAVAVNWKFSLLNNLFSADNSPAEPAISTGATAEEDSYFDKARYARTQSREETVSLLNSVANDENAEDEVRENAYKEIVAYAKMTEGETSLESVLLAKGFEDCIVYLTSDTATVVVAAELLTEQQSAQIFDAVLSQTGLDGGSVKIVAYP